MGYIRKPFDWHVEEDGPVEYDNRWQAIVGEIVGVGDFVISHKFADTGVVRAVKKADDGTPVWIQYKSQRGGEDYKPGALNWMLVTDITDYMPSEKNRRANHGQYENYMREEGVSEPAYMTFPWPEYENYARGYSEGM